MNEQTKQVIGNREKTGGCQRGWGGDRRIGEADEEEKFQVTE